MLPAVSVVIPNWNGAELLRTLFVSLGLQEAIAETIVVDNGSTDNSVMVAEAAGARAIALPRNVGFAAAVNRGVQEARHDWVAVLNTDVELTSGWVSTLLERALVHSAWFATGKLLNASRHDLIDGTYDAICLGGTSWRCGSGRADGPAWNRGGTIQMAPFTALVLRKNLFERVGPLDESFESYLEDVDFGLRCARVGVMGVYVPEAVAYHQGSATLGRWHADTVRRISRNQVLLAAKHLPIGFVFRVFVAQGLWGVLALRHGAGLAWFRGKLEGLRRFRSARGSAFPVAALVESERQIRSLQVETGFDWYWKLYFALT